MPDLRFGYEEALGYCCDPDAVKDKDGITASMLMLEMVAALKAEGRGPQDVLDDLARKFGLYATGQLSVRVADVSLIADAMARLRAAPPTGLGGRNVIALDDLEVHSVFRFKTFSIEYLSLYNCIAFYVDSISIDATNPCSFFNPDVFSM